MIEKAKRGGKHTCVRQLPAGQVRSGSPVGDAAALLQVQVFDVVALLRERAQRRVVHPLAALQTQRLQESTGATANVLNHRPLAAESESPPRTTPEGSPAHT